MKVEIYHNLNNLIFILANIGVKYLDNFPSLFNK